MGTVNAGCCNGGSVPGWLSHNDEIVGGNPQVVGGHHAEVGGSNDGDARVVVARRNQERQGDARGSCDAVDCAWVKVGAHERVEGIDEGVVRVGGKRLGGVCGDPMAGFGGA